MTVIAPDWMAANLVTSDVEGYRDPFVAGFSGPLGVKLFPFVMGSKDVLAEDAGEGEPMKPVSRSGYSMALKDSSLST